MRSVSIGVRDAINNGKRPFIKALVTYRDGFSEWLYDDDFMQNSVQFQNGTSSSGNFEVGSAVIGAFSFNLNNWDHKFDTRNFDGAIISAFIGINPKMFGYALLTEVSEIFVLNDGDTVMETEDAAEQDYSDNTEWFQFGQYYFVKHKSVGNVIICDAYDAMMLFDKSLLTDNAIVYPISAKNVVRLIADHNGITLKNYDFPNGDTVIREAPEDDCTERQMLAYVCQMIGCFARINSTGQLDINWYDDIPATTIMHRFSHSLATEDITITGLRMTYKDVDDQDASSLFLYRKPYKGVLITFDDRSATEADSWDYVRIYYKSGNSYKVSAKFGGHDTINRIAGKTFYIPSNEFWVYWHTDSSQDAYWGWAFTVTPATATKSETLTTVSSLPAYDIEDLPSDYYPQSEHDGHYGHRIDKVWHCKASYYIDTTKDSGHWIPMSGIEADNTDYVLEIAGNPLINASNYEDIEELLADKLIGLTFRHGDMSILANPSFEAGDVVTTFDDKGNRALFLITNIDYSLTVQQTISCDAQEIEKSDLRSIKSTTVARREAKSVIRNEMTAYDTQYMRLTQLMTQSLGFFETKETTASGGYIYYMHNNPDLHESSIIWKMTENTFTVSTDGGQTWNAGITADGNALVNVLSAKGINADWLNTGSIIVQKNGQIRFLADYDTGVVRIVADEFSLSSGDTIQSIANSAAATAKTEAVTEAVQTSSDNLATWINGQYASDMAEIDATLDGKIDTYFMSGTPSASVLPESEWTTTAEKDKHINDLYYDIENNLSYRYAKISGTRITFDSQSETRDYTMDWVEIYYRVDGQLYRLKRPRTNSGQFGGRGSANYIAGISVFIPTYDFYIYWRAATSSNYYGFSLHTEYANDEISDRWTTTGLPSDGGTPIELAQGVLPETNHSPYESGYKIWHVTLDSPSSEYAWIKVEDADVIQALDDASKAQDTADNKRRVFTTTPTVPYDVGDLWTQGASGDILVCSTAKTESQTYSANDWTRASKYTDDTALTTWINGDYADDLEEIATQIDGKAETFYQTSDPSTSWTSAQKTEHTGDLWYNSTSSVQKYYRWNGTAWQELTATPPDEVFDEIDGKAQIFVSQPTTPYNVGDLWFNSATSDIMTCVTARATGNYTASDWEKRNKYTDDSGLTTFVSTVYTPTVNNIQTQIDGKIDTYFMSGTPSASTLPESEWTTIAEKDKHINDMYFDITNDISYRYTKSGSTYSWVKIEDADAIQALADASTAQDTADGKRRVFVTQPVPPYDIGDLWAQGANGDILKCKTAKSASGSYNANDWEKASNYVDQATAKNYTIQQMTQTEVFNKLTNNGTMAGIFMQNNQLYINASYIQSGTLKLGGVNNANGVLEVYNASGTVVGKYDKDGLTAKSLTADSYIKVDGTANSSIKMNYKTYYSHKGSCELNGDGITVNMWGWIYNDQVGSSGGDYVVKLGKRIDPLDDEFSQPYYCYPITMKISHVDGHSDYSSVSFLGPYEFGIGSGTFKTLIMPGVINLTRGKNNYWETSGCTCLSCDGINTVDLLAEGNLVAWGTKSRSVSTPDYSDRLLYCYETTSPLFGDVGEGIIGDDGNCYVWIDSIFAETVTLNQYQVFLQKYGDGDCYVKERKPSYFVVSGTPGMAFGWELKAKQSDFDQRRLEKFTKDKVNLSTDDYGSMAEAHLAEIKKERGESND